MDLLQLDETLDRYDAVKDNLKFFANSDVRAKILISLHQGPKDLSILRTELNFSSSTLLHAIYQLEDKKLVFKHSSYYHLSQMGAVYVLMLLELITSFSSMNKLEAMFLNHEIEVIPPELLIDIDCLEKGYILESNQDNLNIHYKTLSEIVSSSKDLKFISSIFYPFHLDALKEYDTKDRIQFIVTQEIRDMLWADYKTDLKKLSSSKVNLWQIENDLKLSFTIADDFIALGLYLKTGVYDSSRFYICKGNQAVSWGNDLFNYYLNQSTMLKL